MGYDDPEAKGYRQLLDDREAARNEKIKAQKAAESKKQAAREARLAARPAKELKELTTFPTAARIATGVAKTFLALLVGASFALSLIVISASMHLFVTLALAIGSFGFAIKALRDVYKRYQEEKKQMALLADEMAAINQFIDAASLQKSIEMTLQQINDSKLNDQELYLFRDRLLKLQRQIKSVFPDEANQKEFKIFLQTAITTAASKIDKEYNPPVSAVEKPLQDQSKLSLWSRAKINISEGSESTWRYTKKFGNRMLAFVGGASAAAGVGVGIATIFFGMSNPVGWALLGIIGAAVVVGLLAVTIDYVVSRRQEEKIARLKETVSTFSGIKTDINTLQLDLVDKYKYVETRSKLEIAEEKIRRSEAENEARATLQLDLVKTRSELEIAKEKISQLEKENEALNSEKWEPWPADSRSSQVGLFSRNVDRSSSPSPTESDDDEIQNRPEKPKQD